MPTETEWLHNLKAGDEVIVCAGGSYGRRRIATVDRTTATKIVIGAQDFRRHNGFAPGEGYCKPFLVRPTAEEKAKIREAEEREKLVSAIEAVTLRRLPIESLRVIARAVAGAMA